MNELTIFTNTGAVLLAFCAIPQAWRCFVDHRNARGLSWLFLATWGFGELAMLAGLLNVVSWPVLVNYGFNVLLISYMAGVKYANRGRHGSCL